MKRYGLASCSSPLGGYDFNISGSCVSTANKLIYGVGWNYVSVSCATATSPTPAPTTATITTVKISQTLTGVTLDVAKTAAFQTAFISALASILGLPTSAFAITDVSSSRRIRMLLAGVSITYTVTATNTDPAAITKTITTATSSGALAQAVSDNSGGAYSVTAAPPAVLDVSVANTQTITTEGTKPCFSGSETVSLESGESKLISEVVVGDRILSADAAGKMAYSEVIAVPHAKNEIQARFIQLVTDSGRDVKMTGLHMVPAGSCSTTTTATGSLPLVYASAVKTGDCIKTVDGLERVVEVKESVSKGIYSVVTMEEFVVVNGVVASPFAISHVFANVYYNVLRVLYAYLPSAFHVHSGVVRSFNDIVGGAVLKIAS
jgi:Hint module